MRLKDSGIDWIGTIPEHWKVLHLKRVLSFHNGKDYKSLEQEEGVPVIGSGGQFTYASEYLYKGEAILFGRKGTIDKPMYINGQFWTVDTMFYAIPSNNAFGRYLFYEALALPLNKYSTQTALPSMTQTSLQNILICLPPLSEQQAIAAYLDTKLSEIDHQVSLLTSKRDAYLRLKKSIINRAVTKGLNSDVQMKGSGVDWIGMIPKHWEVKRMKEIFAERKEVSETGNEDLLSVSEYYGVAKRKDKISSEDEFETRADSLVGYKICKKGDLVINIMLAWKTGLGVSDYNGIVSPAYAVYRGFNIVPHYYHYLLRTGMYVAEYKRHSKGIIDSRLRLYNDKFYNVSAIYPPLSEQQAIAAYLDEKCSKTDTIVANLDKQISKYADLKRSLIDEIITGKRAV